MTSCVAGLVVDERLGIGDVFEAGRPCFLMMPFREPLRDFLLDN